jgi:hypothetical protein
VIPAPPVTGCWIDVKTGASAPSPSSDWISWADLQHAHDPATGNNYVQVPCPPSATETGFRSATVGYLGGGLALNTSTTTITSPTDRQKIKQDPTQAILTGRANLGPWFLTGQVNFSGTPHGSFSDVFPATPAFNTTATVNSGNVYGFNGDAGYKRVDIRFAPKATELLHGSEVARRAKRSGEALGSLCAFNKCPRSPHDPIEQWSP